MSRTAAYARKCRLLRQIQSNKAQRFRRINVSQSVASVVVSSFLTFMGFSGLDKIHSYLGWIVTLDIKQVEFAFNLLVFLLFVLVILHLVFRFGAKQAESERAIVMLSGMINEIEDALAREEKGSGALRPEEEDSLRQRYTMLIQTIPPNSDKEFLKARTDYQEKEAEKARVQLGPNDLFEEAKLRSMTESLIMQSKDVKRILELLRSTDTGLYLGGGVVRNLVWDYLHEHEAPTQNDDVDVMYFDQLNSTKEHDELIERKLEAKAPNLRWSVKNQARMHHVSGDDQYESLEDAISKSPETATAFLTRLTDEGQVDFIAPFGLTDLYRLIIVATPHFAQKTPQPSSRAAIKGWSQTWPNLRVIESTTGQHRSAQQGSADQPATALQSKPEGDSKPQPESEWRSQ